MLRAKKAKWLNNERDVGSSSKVVEGSKLTDFWNGMELCPTFSHTVPPMTKRSTVE